MINGECRECHNWRASPAVAVRSANKVLVLIKQSVTSALVALAFLGGVAVQATAQVVPSGFTVDTLVNAGLPQPLDFAFLPDGRILVANRLGELHVYAGGAAVQVGVVPAVLSGGETQRRGTHRSPASRRPPQRTSRWRAPARRAAR